MKTLIIKDVPASLHRELKHTAEFKRRSVEKEALALIERGLVRERIVADTPEVAAKLRRQFKRVAAMKDILEATENHP